MVYKYPKTFHVPWSLGSNSSDKFHTSLSQFEGKEVARTEKMDGENTSMYPDKIHARSLDSNHHPSRAYVKQLHATIKNQIPENWRICGENMFAKHSIFYDKLPAYFLVFSIWNENNIMLSLDDTLNVCNDMGLTHVPIIDRFIFDEEKVKNIYMDYSSQEGYVIRITDPIPYDQYSLYTAKYVRENHIQTDEHWMTSAIIKNILA